MSLCVCVCVCVCVSVCVCMCVCVSVCGREKKQKGSEKKKKCQEVAMGGRKATEHKSSSLGYQQGLRMRWFPQQLDCVLCCSMLNGVWTHGAAAKWDRVPMWTFCIQRTCHVCHKHHYPMGHWIAKGMDE